MWGICIAYIDFHKTINITQIYAYPTEQDCLNKYREFLYAYLREWHPYKDFETVNNRFSLPNLELILDGLDNGFRFRYTIDEI